MATLRETKSPKVCLSVRYVVTPVRGSKRQAEVEKGVPLLPKPWSKRGNIRLAGALGELKLAKGDST